MRGLVCGFLLLLMTVSAFAAAPNDLSHAWQTLARIDVEAAYDLLKDNHPAAVPEVGDTQFTSALAAAHAKALSRVPSVASYEGYIATMSEFANAMGDGHIWSNSQFVPRNVMWTGIIAAKRGGEWVVGNDNPKVAGQELAGARIVSCDGASVENLERQAMPFHVSSGNPGLVAVRGAWILIDDGNPFVKYPKSCVFEQDGKDITLALNWTKIAYTKLVETEWKHAYGQAGFGLRASGKGYWIAIQSLEPEAQPVIDAAKAQEDQLRSAAYVVVDLRGNGGGGDSYGRAIASVLYGSDYVDAILGPPEDVAGGCPEAFRASDGNIEAVARDGEKFAKEGDTDGAKEYRQAVIDMKAAKAAGHAFTAPLVCAEKKAAAAPASAASLMHAPVFVLTDALCFSSCISTVDFFRKLGATQLGAPTGSDTHFSEVREIVLPSGLATFSTLQAIMPEAPRKIGPFDPEVAYPGDIADTGALEKWVADTVYPEAGK